MMRAVGRVANNNETQWKAASGVWRKCRRRACRETVNEKCVWVKKLISTKPGCGLNSDTTDLWNLGTIPTNSSSKTTGLVLPRGSASIQLPRSSKPNSLGDSWTFTLYHEGKLRLESATVGQQTQHYSPPGDGDGVKNLCLVCREGSARAYKCSFTPEGVSAAPIGISRTFTLNFNSTTWGTNKGYCYCYRS